MNETSCAREIFLHIANKQTSAKKHECEWNYETNWKKKQKRMNRTADDVRMKSDDKSSYFIRSKYYCIRLLSQQMVCSERFGVSQN